ncbi:hypothetical protein EDE05_114108 [Neorhizobium sp. R1-B]|jgi:hypothetical protein|uniref:hypothetical protein n=1 Tax=Neorhizobium TaxID=1525371 RepID=UPI000CF8E27B|nr:MULTISPECIES: hypothetical protein [Neorhizobium]TCV61783.1 hypothetical protein EDE09_12552 [Neorhizobium sp. S3-V5DH]TDX77798.1 hypothetical protein EDE05_114108 [Neorhizobium sp. R1-B]
MIVWHVVVAILTLTLLGAAVHIFRSSFNFMPDIFVSGSGRFFREHMINDALSTNYSFWDMVAGTEYDEDGFYEFFSLKNLRICCTQTIAVGLAVLFSFDPLWEGFTGAVDQAPGWLWSLFVYRIQNLELI